MHTPFLLSSAVCAFVVVVSVRAAEPETATVAGILKSRDKVDGKLVKVEGTVSQLQLKTSKKGNDYSTFKLKDGDESLSVFAFDHVSVKNGDRVTVTGTFRKEKTVGGNTFKNEIDASPRDGGKVEKKAR